MSVLIQLQNKLSKHEILSPPRVQLIDSVGLSLIHFVRFNQGIYKSTLFFYRFHTTSLPGSLAIPLRRKVTVDFCLSSLQGPTRPHFEIPCLGCFLLYLLFILPSVLNLTLTYPFPTYLIPLPRLFIFNSAVSHSLSSVHVQLPLSYPVRNHFSCPYSSTSYLPSW